MIDSRLMNDNLEFTISSFPHMCPRCVGEAAIFLLRLLCFALMTTEDQKCSRGRAELR